MNTAFEEVLTPCLERIHETNKNRRFRIGLPAEPEKNENRIAITPQAVEVLVSMGHEVIFEKGAGEKAKFKNDDYSSAGAKITTTHKEAFECEIVVRLTLPTKEECEYLSKGATVICCLKHIRRSNDDYASIAQKGCNIIALDLMKKANDDETLLGLCLGDIRGQMAVTSAAHLLQNNDGIGKGVIIGGVVGIPQTEIIILGADTAAFSVAKYALAFGSSVKIFDSSHVRLQKLQDKLGCYNYTFTSIYHPQTLNKALRSADVLVACGAANGTIDYYVTKESLSLLKKGAVILDITPAPLSGIETSHVSTLDNPHYEEDAHLFQCLPDISMLASHTSSIIISDIVVAVLKSISDNGSMDETTIVDDYIKQGTVMLNGTTTNAEVAKWYGTDYIDIRLLRF